MNFRYWSNRIHLWIGLFLAIPLVILGLTGSVLGYRWSLDAQWNSDWYGAVEPVRAADVDWDHLVSSAQGMSPEESVEMFWVDPAGRGAVIAEMSKERMIHLDPSDGSIVGERSYWDNRSVVWWLQDLHANFLLGSWGSTVVSSITVVSLFGLLTGFVLWLIPFTKSVVARFGIRSWTSFPVWNWDFHNVVGFYTFPVVLMVVVTGISIGFWGTLGPLVYWSTGTQPLGFQSPSVDPDSGTYSLNQAVKGARKHWPARNLKRIKLSSKKQPVRMRFGISQTPYEPGLSWIWVDPYTGKVLRTHAVENRSLGDDIYLWLFPLHFGGWGNVWGGMYQRITRFSWSLASTGVAVLAVTGFLIWCKKPN